MFHFPPRFAFASLALLGAAPLADGASSSADRILRFDSAAQVSGNLRQGPVQYSGRGGPMKASVNSVNIAATQATLFAPAGLALSAAQGKRSAVFSGAVQVTRGRLSARGGQLAYSEATGQGVLSQQPSATFTPAHPSSSTENVVNISAQQLSLDIDNNLSTSTGQVTLTSGNQSAKADKLIFDENRELGVLTGNLSLSRAASAGSKELGMTGNEARVLTKTKQMYITGKVRLVQGTTTTTGDALYYDDQKNVAYVIGNAVSYDSRSHNTVKAPARGALEQRTDLGRVRALNTAYSVPTAQFQLSH